MKKTLLPILMLILIFNSAFALEGSMNGATWKAIGSLPVSNKEKYLIKSLLVKEAFESHIFAKTMTFNFAMNKVDVNKIDLIQYNILIRDYIRELDKFYSTAENEKFPLFFAVKLADMVVYGEIDDEMNAFKASIMKRVGGIQ